MTASAALTLLSGLRIASSPPLMKIGASNELADRRGDCIVCIGFLSFLSVLVEPDRSWRDERRGPGWDALLPRDLD
jgi:hypothetical protein